MPTVARIIADTLRAYDVEYFFCVTGGDQELWIALEDTGITVVPCRSEAGAVYAADAYARLTGRPAPVYGQYGPGVTNVAASLADAMWAQSPVVSITSSTRTTSRYRSEYQEIDQLAVMAPFTKWAAAVPRPERAAELVRAAIRHAISTPPGPVHLEIPADVLGVEVDDIAVYAETQFARLPGPRAGADPEAVAAAATVLRSASKPVIVAGNGVLLSGAEAELVAVAEALGAPIATTMGGKGTVVDSHPLSLGVVGRYSRKVANDVLTEADVVLVVGSRMGGLATDGWKRPRPGATVVHIDADPSILGSAYREELGLVADAKLALAALAEELQATEQTAHGWAEKVAGRLAEWRTHVDDAAGSSTSGALHPAQVVQAIREVTAPNDVLVADTGYMGAWTGALFPVEATGRTYLRAAGSLGWAFPAAIGAALAAPERNVVCVSGDGGIGYRLMEMETALRVGAAVKVVVMNNVSLAFEYHDQRYLFDNRILPRVNDFVDVDYAAVARAMGAGGVKVTEPEDLLPALRQALEADGPFLVDVRIDKEVHAPVTVFEKVLPRDV
jgi:acetolactate synthase I/II/III large subunit